MTTSLTAGSRLAEIALPAFGMPTAEPRIPAETYADRMGRLRVAMDANLAAHLPPFLLRPELAMTLAG